MVMIYIMVPLILYVFVIIVDYFNYDRSLLDGQLD